MSMSSEATGTSESSTSASTSESSISNNTAEIKKFDSLTTSKVASSSAGLKEDISDSHLNRLQHLRNELNYINETDWMYESLEKKPQQ